MGVLIAHYGSPDRVGIIFIPAMLDGVLLRQQSPRIIEPMLTFGVSRMQPTNEFDRAPHLVCELGDFLDPGMPYEESEEVLEAF